MGRAWLWTALGVVLIAAASYGLYLYLRAPELPDGVLYGNGHIEGTEVRIAAEVTGRVVESNLVEGRRVAAGDLLVRLDDSDLRLKRDRAAAERVATERERARIEAEIAVWRHHLATAEKDVARYRDLRRRGTVPPQRLEQAENVFREAKGRLAALEARTREIDARLDAATKEIALLDRQIGKTRITAPLDGTILVKAIEPGELAQPGQVVAVMVDLRDIELKVFVPERHIGKVRLDAPARIRVDAFPERSFPARVARVDQQAQFTPRDIHMPEERVRMVFGVTLRVNNRNGILKPGMPADAWILWDETAGWPDRLFVPR